jgi:hypothetical protein
MLRASVARVIGVSLLTGGLWAGLGLVLFGPYSSQPDRLTGFILGCVGCIVGAVAGAAREIVTAMHQKPPI